MIATIVIPAYKPHTLLEGCLAGIYNNTDSNLIEVIVVCNGSDRESVDLVCDKFPQTRLVWYNEPIGFTKAANVGFRLVDTPFTIIANTDSIVLDFAPRNYWLKQLVDPFDDPEVGLTGICTMRVAGEEFFPFFFTAIRTELFQKIGYLDLAFSPGYGEDIDFCIRARQANYKLVKVVGDNYDGLNNVNVGYFPLYHKGEGSFTDPHKRQQYINNSEVILAQKYNLSL